MNALFSTQRNHVSCLFRFSVKSLLLKMKTNLRTS